MIPLRNEGIRLYRDIVRATKLFNFRNPQGQLWYVFFDVIKFEQHSQTGQIFFMQTPEKNLSKRVMNKMAKL